MYWNLQSNEHLQSKFEISIDLRYQRLPSIKHKFNLDTAKQNKLLSEQKVLIFMGQISGILCHIKMSK